MFILDYHANIHPPLQKLIRMTKADEAVPSDGSAGAKQLDTKYKLQCTLLLIKKI